MTSSPESIFSPDSPQARAIVSLWTVNFVVCALIFTVVAAMVAVGLCYFRGRPGDADPKQVAENRRIEVAWLCGPVAIVALLFVLNLRAMARSDPPPSGPDDLEVIGHQWWWEIRDLRAGIVTANEVHIPVGRPVSVRLDTADVLHEFWVPRLTRKMTAVPLAGNHIWIEADHPGIYRGVCSEFCGTEHAWMRVMVVAQPPAEFAAWEKAQERAAAAPSGEAADGLRLMRSMTCVNCHAIRGLAPGGTAGPDLTHFASRRTFGSGVLANTPANLRRWLADPQKIKPGVKMPDFNLKPAQLDALVACLESLR
ncbi:MAG TPA: cytochrome c oxidase subunit II [Opitutaceae bacterium]|nr:cytochrome c oxidase subunit II [Opitutaceae bacterium]